MHDTLYHSMCLYCMPLLHYQWVFILLFQQTDRLEDAAQALQANEFLRKETASLRIELKLVKRNLERTEAARKSVAVENKSLHALVAESDAQVRINQYMLVTRKTSRYCFFISIKIIPSVTISA